MIVVDTNIITYLFIAGEKTELAREVYAQDAYWVAPALWKHEFLNVLATNVKHGLLSAAEAKSAWQFSRALLYQREQQCKMTSALLLAIENDISAYDAQFVALAQELDRLLVTEDRRIQAKFPTMTSSMKDFVVKA